MKKEPRGTFDYRFDTNNEILIVRWLDNKCVTMGTNYDTVEPLNHVLRWRKQEKVRGNVDQPHVLSSYNVLWEELTSTIGSCQNMLVQ